MTVRVIVLVSFLCLGAVREGYGQIVYADEISSVSPQADRVWNRQYAINVTDHLNDPATVRSSGGLLLGGLAWQGHIELKFNHFPNSGSTLPAGTTSFVRLGGGAQNILDIVVGGSLGSALADLLGSVVLGNHYFTIEARNGNTTVASNRSDNGFNSTQFRIVFGADGNYYAAITPNQAYDRIRIIDNTDAVLLGATNSSDVYYAFYVDGAAPCNEAFATSYDVSGVNLDLLDLGGSVATNIHHAIDGNIATYSALSPGLLGVSGNLQQYFYFDDAANSTVNITLGAAPSVLNLSLLNNITFIAYDGANTVYTENMANLGLGLDLLGLLEDGQPVSFAIQPVSSFDRFEIRVNTALGLGTGESLRIYEVSRTPKITLIDEIELQDMLTGCGSVDLSSAIANYQPELFTYYFYDQSDNLLASSEVTESGTYYIQAEGIATGCMSNRVAIEATIISLPAITLGSIPVICEGETTVSLFYNTITGDPDQYDIIWDDGVPTDFIDVTDIPLSSSPIVISIPETAETDAYTGTLIVRNSVTGCQSEDVPFSLMVLPRPGKPHLTITDAQN